MKLKECLEKIQEKKYENVSLWAKNNFNGWYMVQAKTPNGLANKNRFGPSRTFCRIFR